jgi:hypothetical protein
MLQESRTVDFFESFPSKSRSVQDTFVASCYGLVLPQLLTFTALHAQAISLRIRNFVVPSIKGLIEWHSDGLAEKHLQVHGLL